MLAHTHTKKPKLIFNAHSVAFGWFFFSPFPYYLAYFDLFFPLRENHQVQKAPVLLHSSGRCLLFLHRLSWLRNSSPPRNSWVSVNWWAALFTKHVYILMRGFNQKNDLNNEDFRCFIMRSQQNSKFCVCVIFFSPPKGMTLWFFLFTSSEGVRSTWYMKTLTTWN